MRRELREELGIEVEVQALFHALFHEYPEYPVLLLAYRCEVLEGSPRPLGVRDLRWADLATMGEDAMPPADYPVAEKLKR